MRPIIYVIWITYPSKLMNKIVHRLTMGIHAYPYRMSQILLNTRDRDDLQNKYWLTDYRITKAVCGQNSPWETFR